MFSKEESTKMRQEFWTSFGKSFPIKWTLYDTKIKGFAFKFHFDTKKARVLLEIDGDLEHRLKYFEKLQSLQDIILSEFWEDAIFDDQFLQENGKEISAVYVEKQGVSIHNRNTWQETMVFLNEKMQKLEDFWQEYEDFFKMEDF